MTKDVLFVGSVGLNNAEEVFRTAAGILGERLPRIPDGETGNARSVWIQCQMPFFYGNPQFEMVEPDPANPGEMRPARMPSAGLYSFTQAGRYQGRARVRPGVTEVTFDNCGYADWAQESYGTFKRLKQEGVIPPATKFQVCIPSPRATLQLTLDRDKIGPAYYAAIGREVERMASTIPNDELSIQWDCTEPPTYDASDASTKQEIIDGMVRIGKYVPASVELGYHLCYGDFEHKHGVQPKDTAAMVEMTNTIVSSVGRSVGWVHMPVPRDRSDIAYFEPLRNLKLPPETQLYLGLVHYTDGVDGTRKRMASADQLVSNYGIATECGFGRRPDSHDIRDLMKIHAEVANQ